MSGLFQFTFVPPPFPTPASTSPVATIPASSPSMHPTGNTHPQPSTSIMNTAPDTSRPQGFRLQPSPRSFNPLNNHPNHSTHPSRTNHQNPHHYPNISVRFEAASQPQQPQGPSSHTKSKPAPPPNPLPAWFDQITAPVAVDYGRGYVPIGEGRVGRVGKDEMFGGREKKVVVKGKGKKGKNEKKDASVLDETRMEVDPATATATASSFTPTSNPTSNQTSESTTATAASNTNTASNSKPKPPHKTRLINLPRPTFLPPIPGPGLALLPSLNGGVGDVDFVGVCGSGSGSKPNSKGGAVGEGAGGKRGKKRVRIDETRYEAEATTYNSDTATTTATNDTQTRAQTQTQPRPHFQTQTQQRLPSILRPSKMSTTPCSMKRKVWVRENGPRAGPVFPRRNDGGDDGNGGSGGQKDKYEKGQTQKRLRSGMRVLVDPIPVLDADGGSIANTFTSNSSNSTPTTPHPAVNGSIPFLLNPPTPQKSTAPSPATGPAATSTPTPNSPVDLAQLNKQASERLKLSVQMALGMDEEQRKGGGGMKVCKYWARGFCKDSSECSYLHPIPDRPFDKWLVPVPSYITRALNEQKRRREINDRRVRGQKVAQAIKEGKVGGLDKSELIRRAPMVSGTRFEEEEMARLPVDVDLDGDVSMDGSEEGQNGPGAGSEDAESDDGFDIDTESEMSDGDDFDMDQEEIEIEQDDEFQSLLQDVLAAGGSDTVDDNDPDGMAIDEPEDGATIPTNANATARSTEHEQAVIYFKSGGPNDGPFACRLPNDYMRDPRFNPSLIQADENNQIDENLFIKCSYCQEDAEEWFLSKERGKKKVNQKMGRSKKTLQVYPECGHACCNDCTRKARHPGKPKKKGDTVDRKKTTCIVCIRKSEYTFPTNLGVRETGTSSERMEECMENYKEYMKSKLCKYIVQTTKPNRKPFCPFGDDCFYKHEVRGKPYRFKRGVKVMMVLYKTNRNNRHERSARRAARLRRFGRNLSTRLNKLWKIINLEIYRRHPWKTYSKPSANYAAKISIDLDVDVPMGKVVLERLCKAGKTEFASKLRKGLEVKRVKMDVKPDLTLRRTILDHVIAIVYEKWPTVLPVQLTHPTRVAAAAVGGA